ncbi:MAG: response regulator [Planctomycetales bacterium]|nr:response regulator [Planctomycetales bacterium]
MLWQPIIRNSAFEVSEVFRLSILVAEDGLDNQRLISSILKKAGASVVVAPNGQVAVDHVAAGKDFDVTLMDMQMPILDGYSATRVLRERGYTGPIVALTAHAMASDRQACLDAGCDDYATKPIDRKKLVAIVASHAQQAASVA